MKRLLALLFALVGLSLYAGAQSLSYVGNTSLFLNNVGQIPNDGAYIQPWQSLTVTTQTYPISTGQSVQLVFTTNNWQSSSTVNLNFDHNVGNNTQWYATLSGLSAGSDVQFYIQANTTNGITLYDNNSSQNYEYVVRNATAGPQGAILQWFATPYKTITQRLPEVVNAGYDAIYLPPPTKAGGGGFSVGYNPTDRFDLGDRFQFGGTQTQYGSTSDLYTLIQTAHRFGLKVYCDLVLNHNDNRASTAIDGYPNVIPEDFHIFSSADTDNNQIDFNDNQPFSGNILNNDLSGLADIAHEDGNLVENGPFTLPSWASFNPNGKPSFVRQPLDAFAYPNYQPVAEDVRQYLNRWGWWLTTEFGFDGYRLDAVRHMDPAFFHSYSHQAGFNVTGGSFIPTVLSVNPNAFFFSEDNSTDNFEQREFIKTGMSLLDFPLFYSMQNLFSSQGFGNLGQALSNPYGIDPATGLGFQNGGLSPDVDVSFVQSHDSGPPQSNNLAYAFTMTRPGATIAYFDGLNEKPGDYTQFPKPGRYDCLGAGDDYLLRDLDARHRFGRGLLVNRSVGANLYVYERQVNGEGVLLVGLNNRGDQTSLSTTVSTAFAPGTQLEDLSGQEPNLTVQSDGTVNLTVPANSSSTNNNNATGYVLYAPIAPHFLGTGVGISVGSTPALFSQVETPAASYGPGGSYFVAQISSSTFSVSSATDTPGSTAFLKIDSGIAPPGYFPLSNTPEGLTDGFIPMNVSGSNFQLPHVDLSGFGPGLHCLRVRTFAPGNGRPGVFRDAVAFVDINSDGALAQVTGDLSPLGNPIATQVNAPSSESNRLDELFAANDDQNLYLGFAGETDPSLSYTNGLVAFLDTHSGGGISSTRAISDDSGPATRLLSNAQVSFSQGFSPQFAFSCFRQTTISATSNFPWNIGSGTPPPVGAETGLFQLDAAHPLRMVPLACKTAWQPRSNPFGPSVGLEAGIPLRELFPNGVQPGQTISFFAYLGTTGESGTILPAHDPSRGMLGGRPAANAYLTNQLLPAQPNISTDPGTAPIAASSFANLTLRFGTTISNVQISGSTIKPFRGQSVQLVTITNTGTSTVGGRPYLVIHVPSGSTASVIGGFPSLRAPNTQYIPLAIRGIPAGKSVTISVQYAGVSGSFTPSFELRQGPGIE